jgi:hypothetical protein
MTGSEVDRPWEQGGAVRRDAEPDRGLLLCVLGLAALVLAPVGGVVVGAVVWRLADADIRKMRAGRMHRSGMWDAQHARQCAMGSVMSATLMYVLFGGFALWQALFGP